MQFGISTFGEVGYDGVSGKAVQAHKRMQEIIEEARLSDEWGLDVFALGEHHRPDYVISATTNVLSAIAAVTENIRLSSAVTVLSSSDPVRVFQEFATLDLISSGRAEIMAGRGSFIESFPLFGYDLKDYNELFTEKLELLMKINDNERISWNGKFRAPLDNKGIYPRPFQEKVPIWIAVGGTPASIVRAGKLGLPLTIAILGANPVRFQTLTDLYRETWTSSGHDIKDLQLCINEHLYISDSHQRAVDEYWPVYGEMMNRIGRERGWSPMNKQDFEWLCGMEGSLMVGTVEEVVKKMIYHHKLFDYTRFLAQIIWGKDMPHEKILHSVNLFANKVVPVVKKEILD